ncbi:Sulfate adenylyltransferase subunit 2 [hydrothermal vent metagenome]|uniref:Sulfate adenylyltransferase subunit 2 n=1 Tax=hydrothermal vent metagenome TaxID=652676 RepID=A0A3B0RMJ6_9ZZZZ
MDDLATLLTRAEQLANATGRSVSTISRKIFNDGKGIARLQAGGQCTLKTLERAYARLVNLEKQAANNTANIAAPMAINSSVSNNEITHLDRLEAQSIHIFREVVAECQNPVLLYSMGKDSSVMLHLAKKAFFPGPLPFPLLHVDSHWKFKQMLEFREQLAKQPGIDLMVYKNQQGVTDGIGPFTHGPALHTEIMKTQALKQALDKYQFDACFGGARRDEEKSRAKERVFSIRDSHHHWDPKNQRPELWNIYNTKIAKDESLRVFPLSNWTEIDVWHYIYREKITIPSLYFAALRPVVFRDGQWLMVDDDRFALRPGEKIVQKMIRFRTLGCYPLTAGVPSQSTTLPQVIRETLLAQNSEREGRMIDQDADASMEAKKQEGYF